MAEGVIPQAAMESNKLSEAAKSLLNRAFKSHHEYYGICTTTCQVYDTAWVAMITKETDGVKNWLFPESFYYLLRTQSDDGSWGVLPTTQTAGILDTASALLALLSHAKEPLQILDISKDKMDRTIDHGFKSLSRQLAGWDDIEMTNHIGVELIVPSLLTSLEEARSLPPFDFPCKEVLRSMHEDKLRRFDPEKLYSKPSSLLHSLEAFLGEVDFDRLSHFLYHGSMMASPSSTAAYLIGSSKWDDRAEAYLRYIVREGAGHGGGGIPGTFPTTHFECSWVIATLLKAGFSKEQIDCDGLSGLSDILYNALQNEHGVIGFDVDDTAKALLALSIQGRHVSPDQMIKVFEGRDHFTTFGSERDPSLTSNLHVLLCLLKQPDLAKYHPQIIKTTKFVCGWWWDSDSSLKDKWHLSHLYPTMLLVEAFTELLQLVDSGELPDLLNETWRFKIGLSVFQAVLRIIIGQREDGSWAGYREQTCYAILALGQARRVCFFAQLDVKLQSCINRAASWLSSSSPRSQDLTWTSKTAYQVAFVAEAYQHAALQSAIQEGLPSNIGYSLASSVPLNVLENYMRLVRKTPMFSSVDEWLLRASIVESAFFVPLLQAQRLEVYPRDESKLEEDKYLSIIPFTWVGCNNRSRTFASNSWLYDMMYLSLLGYQTDEFMEAVAGPAFSDISQLHDMMDSIIDSTLNGSHSIKNGHRNGHQNGHQNGSAAKKLEQLTGNGDHELLSSVLEIEEAFTRFTVSVLNHQAVLRSSHWDRQNLHQEFRAFMHAHITQLQDNARFAKLDSCDTLSSPDQLYYQWANSTGGSHVACAYSLAFSNCLISANLYSGQEAFATVSQKYFISATMCHATTTCRMYNDFGSIDRDNAERNVNSIHFPEFSSCSGTFGKKKSLQEIAEYEQECTVQALAALESECRKNCERYPSTTEARKIAIVRVFCDVADLYNQFYVIKDLSSHLK